MAIRPPQSLSSQFTAPNTWRGFLLRVATIAVAALLVLGAMDLIEYLRDSHPAPHPYRSEPTLPSRDVVP